MPLTINNRPPLPGMPRPGETVNMHNKVKTDWKFRGPTDVTEAFKREVAEIETLLRSFHKIYLTGTLTFVVVPDRPRAERCFDLLRPKISRPT